MLFRSKRGITLDLNREEGRAIARRLMQSCDVVCENFTPRVMDDWGLGYDAVKAERPDVVMLRLPAFGLSGPWRDRPGFAQTMEQLTGMAWATGYEGGPPIIAGGVVDPMVGAHAALAVVAALVLAGGVAANRRLRERLADGTAGMGIALVAPRPLFVESGDRADMPDGDGGLAIGPYQIHEVYWRDAIEFAPDLGGDYAQCRQRRYAERVIDAYMQRHAAAAWAAGDAETIARVHNGGPYGKEKAATLRYWERVRARLP